MSGKAVDSVKTGVATKATPLQRFISILEIEAATDSTFDSTGFVENILNSMIEAETLEDALAAQNAGSTGGRDLVGTELEVRGFTLVKAGARYKSLLGHYMLVDAINLNTLQESPFNTGAPNIMINLWKARETNRLPLPCVIRSRDTDNGTLLTLEILPKRPISAEPAY